mmetsp:Transcript_1760/g.2761  ORF Transcript_1760/g.2761 Transcript_1760/m.2761 type:complete len:794 (+) Transcript_1760:36-2417(+)|eukprot:CAMPEP_0185020396 /NCGR_PEP_ID=MMETSP1103-20130426/2997_1 /TAXON_ID=36769 /ORGANISM="Paraphysomonas bandaiensis, Strain Caron Lab Isolate" /LENGTH=793 /DNA_ID=CAMNT_0027551269 /DNA_START=10 /DNA_END=2391 /DNA_ORIENTATION=-
MQALFVLLYGAVVLGVVTHVYGSKSTEVYVGLSNSTVPLPLEVETVDLVSGDQFGRAVSIWGSTCIVSAKKRAVTTSGSADDDGLVFVFKQTDDRKWVDTGLILASYQDEDGFGESLSLSQGAAVIGAPKDDSYGYNSGKAYVFYSVGDEFLKYSEELVPSNPRAGDFFGFSVAIVHGHGKYAHAIVVGAYGHNHDDHMEGSGSVFIFTSSGSSWYETVVMQPSEPYQNGYFGWSVAGYGNAVAVGAPGQESVFLFHLEPVEKECPHEGPPEDMPSGCEHHRKLKVDADGEEQQRSLQGEPPHTYTSWEYVEILHVQNDLQYYAGDKFGSSVSVINETTLTVVAGSPFDNDYGATPGAVLIMSLLPYGDVWSTWTPSHPDDHPEEHEHHNGDVKLEDMSTEQIAKSKGINLPPREKSMPRSRINSERRSLQGGPEEHRHNVWRIRSYEYTIDKDGNYWMLMSKKYGSNSNEMFGYTTAVSDKHVLVGTFPPPTSRGRAELLVFNSTGKVNSDSPVYKGPLYMKEWVKETNIYDRFGGNGDYFGSSVSLYGDTALIGGFLTGFKGGMNIGTGAAYIFDAVQIVKPSSSKVDMSETGAIAGMWISAFIIITAVLIAAGYASMKLGRWYVDNGGLDGKIQLSSLFNVDKPNGLDVSSSSVDTMDANSRHPLRPSDRSNHGHVPTAYMSGRTNSSAGPSRESTHSIQSSGSSVIPQQLPVQSSNRRPKTSKTAKYMQQRGPVSYTQRSSAPEHGNENPPPNPRSYSQVNQYSPRHPHGQDTAEVVSGSPSTQRAFRY